MDPGSSLRCARDNGVFPNAKQQASYRFGWQVSQ
jgi:hypothetical protein